MSRPTTRDVKRWIVDGRDVREEFVRLQRLPCWRSWGVQKAIQELELRLRRSRKFSSTGHHRYGQNNIHVTAGTGPWYITSVVILHEMIHRAYNKLGKHRTPGRNRQVHHDAEFHDMLRVAACQAYDIEANALWPLYKKFGGARRAYSMDIAIRHLLAEQYGNKATSGETHQASDSENESRFFRLLDDNRIEVKMPYRAINAAGFDEPDLQKEYEVECIYMKAGRGYFVLLRAHSRALQSLRRRLQDYTSVSYGYVSSASDALACKTAINRITAALKHLT